MKPDKDTETKRARFRPGLALIALFGVAALIAAWKVADYVLESRRNMEFWENLQDSVVIMHETAPPDVTGPSPGPNPMDQREQSGGPEDPSVPKAIDFDALRELYGGVVAWIFAPDTRINYAIAQSGDNSYYLRRLLDGTGAICGSIFADYRCSPDFSDWNTIIYGHKMDDDTMFASLANYLDQSYYEEHPVMYLYIPGQRYRLELLAGYTTDVNDMLYCLPESREGRDTVLAQAMERSSFRSGVTVGEDDRLVTLSTCSYAFNNARYIVIGRLVDS